MTSAGARPAYWMSGGSLVGRAGPLDDDRAAALFVFLGRSAWRCAQGGDAAGARYCAARALELARAIVAAERWRRAAAGFA